MRQEALKMILGMLAVGILITAASGSVLALISVGLAAWAAWCVAKGLDG